MCAGHGTCARRRLTFTVLPVARQPVVLATLASVDAVARVHALVLTAAVLHRTRVHCFRRKQTNRNKNIDVSTVFTHGAG